MRMEGDPPITKWAIPPRWVLGLRMDRINVPPNIIHNLFPIMRPGSPTHQENTIRQPPWLLHPNTPQEVGDGHILPYIAQNLISKMQVLLVPMALHTVPINLTQLLHWPRHLSIPPWVSPM